MDRRADLASILPFLPVVLDGANLAWRPPGTEVLHALSLGPGTSGVDSGKALFGTIVRLRDAIGLAEGSLGGDTAEGFAYCFDEMMPRSDAAKWFGEVVPSLARLLLSLPSLLEFHYKKTDEDFGEERVGLRMLESQNAGFVFMSQELISALLASSLFCLFPSINRHGRPLQMVNFDELFTIRKFRNLRCHQHKIKCLLHYFQKVCTDKPNGFVSFERKVIPRHGDPKGVLYPDIDVWKNSKDLLCPFKVFTTGAIEDDKDEVTEVDFADRFLGGIVLYTGCLQEEIRFIISPELIAGMLFMPVMEDNEAIEIVGTERFSRHTGYDHSFCFAGDYTDIKPFDSLGRRKTRVLAIDAFEHPGSRQYRTEFLLREVNKAYCGFLDQSKQFFQFYQGKPFFPQQGNSSTSLESGSSSERPPSHGIDSADSVGIATGNWGCGVFGGDPEIKSMLQWIAASQARRPFIHYYTFQNASLAKLEKVVQHIMSHGWVVSRLWNTLIKYGSERLTGHNTVGFFSWLLSKKG